MRGPQFPRSSLARLVPQPPARAEELTALRKAAWLRQGVAVLPLCEIRDDWTRQVIINEATRLYGKREGKQ